jgi:hypothetical protein
MSHENMKKVIRENAIKSYKVKSVVERYMEAVENLTSILTKLIDSENVKSVLDEIILQNRLEFNYDGKISRYIPIYML